MYEIFIKKNSLRFQKMLQINTNPEHGMTIARNDLAAFKRSPDVVLDLLVRNLSRAKCVPHLNDPAEHLLVGETV